MSLRVVIIGAGEVGFNLAKTLSNDDCDLTIIDIDSKKCQRITNSIDAHVIHGDGASQRILQDLDMGSVDYLLALSRIDEVNLVASKSASEMGAKKIICRLRNTEYSHRNATITPMQFGIDHVVYPEKSAQKEIEKLIRKPSAIDVEEFYDGKITMVGMVMDSSSPLIGRSAVSVELSNPYVHHKLVLLIRDGEGLIPQEDTTYKIDDLAYFMGRTDEVPSIQRMAGKSPLTVKNVMILGAGKIGRLLSKSLETDYDVRIIENNHEKAKKVSESLSDTLILDADGLDIDFLTSENIQDVDCFIAATANEQTNILASLLVRHYGVKQVILHVTTTNYIRAVRRIGVDAVISKNISAVHEIINFIRSDQEDLPVSKIEDVDYDALEIVVSSKSKFILKNYSFDTVPDFIRVGTIIRGDKVIIPSQHAEILSNDKLILFIKDNLISKAEDLFL
jgi:trk system potassium uptake protein TrkA